MTYFLTVVTFMFVTAATASAAHSSSAPAADGRIATASRPESHRKIEIESADDFILASRTVLHEAAFTGLLDQGERAKSAKCV
jgi:hypothetical protein